MVNENQDLKYNKTNVLGVLLGMLIGGLAGAVAMWLLAPQSGRDTRKQIKEKGIELRDRTGGMMDDAMEQVRSNTSRIAIAGRQKAEEFKQHGQELLAGQLGRVSAAAQAGKKVIQSS
jgi:gas vesicle protein